MASKQDSKAKKKGFTVNKLKAEAKSLGQKILAAVDREIIDANKFLAKIAKDLKVMAGHEKASMKQLKAAEAKVGKAKNAAASKEVAKARKAASEAFAAARHAAEKFAGANQALAKIKVAELAVAVVERANKAVKTKAGKKPVGKAAPIKKKAVAKKPAAAKTRSAAKKPSGTVKKTGRGKRASVVKTAPQQSVSAPVVAAAMTRMEPALDRARSVFDPAVDA